MSASTTDSERAADLPSERHERRRWRLQHDSDVSTASELHEIGGDALGPVTELDEGARHIALQVLLRSTRGSPAHPNLRTPHKQKIFAQKKQNKAHMQTRVQAQLAQGVPNQTQPSGRMRFT